METKCGTHGQKWVKLIVLMTSWGKGRKNDIIDFEQTTGHSPDF